MANTPKTIIPLTENFPFDINTFKPKLSHVEIFDRGSENPEHRYSLKTSSEKYCIISEDEKFVTDLLDGEKTINELAAAFMEQKGRIAVTMIRNFIYRLWTEGILSDTAAPQAEHVSNATTSSFKIPIPGIAGLAKRLSPVVGTALFNPLSVLMLLSVGAYGLYILFQLYNDPSREIPLFVYKNDPMLGLMVMLATFTGAAIVRYVCKLMLHSTYKIKVKRSGLQWAQIAPGFFIEAPGITTQKASSRFFLKTVGMIVNFGIAGVLIIIVHYLALPKDNELLLVQVAFYLILYLIYQCCPMLDNDLYEGCTNYLDEPYLRKSSFAFVSRHLRRFFDPTEAEKSDNVIYIMYVAAVILWITCTVQILLFTLSQNSLVLSGLFSSDKAFSSRLILILVLLPIIVGFLTSFFLSYKFLVKSITSQEIFKNTRNLIILSAILILLLILTLKLFDTNNNRFILNVLTYTGLILAIKHSLSLSKLLQKSLEQIQYLIVPFFALSLLLYLVDSHFLSDNRSMSFVSMTLLGASLLIYSLISIIIDWREFYINKRDSLIISIVVLMIIALTFYLSSYVQSIAVSGFSFQDGESISESHTVRNRSVCLYVFIIGGLSLMLNVPSIVYKRRTQSFAPFFSIVSALHLLLYLTLLSMLRGDQIDESMAALSLILTVGLGSYKLAINGQHSHIPTFPFNDVNGEKERLIVSFEYITQTSLAVIKSDLGEARSEAINRKFKEYLTKLGWDLTLKSPENKEIDINVLSEQYNAAFQKFSSLIINYCGQSYAVLLLKELDDHLHSGAREIIYARVPSFKKFESEKRHIKLTFEKKKEIVDKILLFQHVKKEEIPSLVQCLQSVSYQPGDLIIKQYDAGDRLFILVEGSAQVEVEDLAGNTKIVSCMTNHEFFGEIALLTSSERTASVRATEECTVLYLKRKDFDSFLDLDNDRKERIMTNLNYLRIIKALPLFKSLEASTVNLLASQMVRERFARGEDIIKQGSTGNKFYIILQGHADVHVLRDDKKDYHIATLGRGEYFGEIALFKNIPRTATVTAASDEVLLISLQKNHFSQAINEQPVLQSKLENVTHRRIVEIMQ